MQSRNVSDKEPKRWTIESIARFISNKPHSALILTNFQILLKQGSAKGLKGESLAGYVAEHMGLQ